MQSVWMKRTTGRGRRMASITVGLGLLAAATGCGDPSVPLEVAPGSGVTIEVPGRAPVTVPLRGRVRARAQLPIDLAAVAAGRSLLGTLAIEEVLLVGEPTTIVGISTGISCTSLAAQSGGSITVNAQQGRLRIDAVINNQTRFTAPPEARELGALMLRNPLRTEVAADLGTLLGVLAGGALPIDFVQRIDDVSKGGPLDGTRVSGDIRFRTPVGDLSQIPGLAACRQFVAAADAQPPVGATAARD